MLQALLCHCCPVPSPQPVPMYCGYTLLPSLGSITASILQLSVPCLAMLGGVVFLGESLTVRTIFSALAVLTGIVMVTREKSPRQPMAKARKPQ